MGGFGANNLMKWIMDFLLNECNFGGIEIVANLVVFLMVQVYSKALNLVLQL
jgi:hypothetical protein